MEKNRPITLVATIGSSPAVLTEAVYALHQRKLWPVTEIEIITTAHGAEKIKEGLFGKGRNWIRLCDEIGIDPFQIKLPSIEELEGVRTSDGDELEDIRNSVDDQAMASYVQKTVRELTSDKSRRVFALLSGGRKTMSSHLMSAMQLFGRRDDRLFHILVSDPYDRIKDFWFPTKDSKHLELKNPLGEVFGNYDAKDAKIDLIDIPYIRLRSYLETQIDYSDSFEDIVAAADEKLLTREEYPIFDLHIHLNGGESGIYINGLENCCEMEPRLISILALFVWMNINQGEPFDIRWRDVIKDEDLRKKQHIFYRTAKQGNLEDIDETFRSINLGEFDDEWLDYDYWHNEYDEPMKRAFAKNKSVLFSKLEKFLQASGISNANREHIVRDGSHGKVVDRIIRVPVPVSKCRITGLHEKDAEILGLDD